MKKPWSVKVKGYTIAFFRKLFYWSERRKSCINGAAAKCEKCGKRVSKLYADHINPVTEIGKPPFVFDDCKGFSGLDAYANRMLLGSLQALCKRCHQIKTNEETKLRKAARDMRKEA